MTAHGKFGLRIGCQKNAGMTGQKSTRAAMDVRKRKGQGGMKELVNRIFNGEVVDITSANSPYYISVTENISGFKVGFVAPSGLGGQGCYMSTNDMRDAGRRLVSLADELDRRMKFVDRCKVYIVTPSGGIAESYFDSTSSAHLADVAFGNIFKTHKEAEVNKAAVLAKYKALKDEGLV